MSTLQYDNRMRYSEYCAVLMRINATESYEKWNSISWYVLSHLGGHFFRALGNIKNSGNAQPLQIWPDIIMSEAVYRL